MTRTGLSVDWNLKAYPEDISDLFVSNDDETAVSLVEVSDDKNYDYM